MSSDLTFVEKLQEFRKKYFPERQLFLRSEGRVRFVTIGSRTQMVASAALLIAAGWGVVTSYSYLTRDFTLEAKNRTISNMSAQYEALSNDFSALEVEVERRADQLEMRQRFLEDMVGVETPAVAPDPGLTTPPAEEDASSGQSPDAAGATLIEQLLGTGTAHAASVSNPDAVFSNIDRRKRLLSRLRDMDQRQKDLAQSLLSALNQKVASIDKILLPTKLSNDALISKAEMVHKAFGGPYVPDPAFEPIFADDDTSAFMNLINVQGRLEMVTKALDSFPHGKPAEKFYLSSKFGRRIDPIKKTWARHSGVDLAGWPGTAIYATAPGKVVHAGWYGPYGNMVEIDHGNGFKTRYGHMRKLRVKKGEEVTLGHRIGDMGKTGRVTDTHLHYEVWFDGKLRDPMPFMKAANDVLEIQGRHEKTVQQ